MPIFPRSLICLYFVIGTFKLFAQSGYFVEGDVLYWKASEEGLSFALKSPGSSLKEPDFEWDIGFKLGLGYRFSQGWNILLRLTHLHTHADSLLKATDDAVLYPVWIQGPGEGLFAEQIKMHWRLHFACIDALFSKALCPSAFLFITPHLGLRYALARQKFHHAYRGGQFTPDTEEYLRMKNKFWGIGPYGALGIQWLLSRHFSLCATAGFSAMYGQFYVHEAEDLFAGNVKIFGLLDTFYRIAVTAEAGVLLRWQKVWDRSKRRLYVQMGWDTLLFISQNQLQRFFNDHPLESPGNLGLKGFEWGVGWDF